MPIYDKPLSIVSDHSPVHPEAGRLKEVQLYYYCFIEMPSGNLDGGEWE